MGSKILWASYGALDKIVKWMTSPEPGNRPTAKEILATPEHSG